MSLALQRTRHALKSALARPVGPGRATDADGDPRDGRARWRAAYAIGSLALIALYPFLPGVWMAAGLLLACVTAAVCVVIGRRAVEPGRRAPWTLLICALAAYVLANTALAIPEAHVVAVGWLIDAAGDLLALAGALALILRRGARDLGGIVDAAVIAFAVGSVLWTLLPRRIGSDSGPTAQVDLFVTVFALTGVLGALLRLSRVMTGSNTALRLLHAAIGLAIAGNAVSALGGASPATSTAAAMIFMAVFTAVGLFGLDPTGPRLMASQTLAHTEHLSTARLVFLGTAIAVVPGVVGVRGTLAGNPAGLLLAVQGALVSTLVMIRIGILAAQRSRAERALAHQAAHDPLTQLPNRRQFVDRLRGELARGTRCALLFCDLDDFKSVNDRFGHDAGDRLLMDVAQRLLACAGPRQMVSRFGGDEFVVLLMEPAVPEAQAVRDRITAALGRPFQPLRGRGMAISVGIADDRGERDPEQLIKAADHAMYEAKAAHRNAEAGGWNQGPGDTCR